MYESLTKEEAAELIESICAQLLSIANGLTRQAATGPDPLKDVLLRGTPL